MKIIFRGLKSTVYELDNFSVLKLYDNKSYEKILNEYNNAKLLYSLRIRTPNPIRLQKVNNKNGIIFEKIHGVTVLKAILKKPWKVIFFAKNVARLHRNLHEKKEKYNITKLIDVLYNEIEELDFTNEQKKYVFNYINLLDNNYCLCHGDLHLENIMTDYSNIYIIDLMRLCIGDPAADVARSIIEIQNNLLSDYYSVKEKIIYFFLRRIFLFFYLKEYSNLSGIRRKEISKWYFPIIVAELAENNPDKVIRRFKRIVTTKYKLHLY